MPPKQARTNVSPSTEGLPLEQKLLAYVTQTPGATYQEMAVNFQVAVSTVRKTVRGLRCNKLVRVKQKDGRAEVTAYSPAVWRPKREKTQVIHAADLFCGLGGFSGALAHVLENMGLDLKTQVDLVAINHSEKAIALHAKQHPWARHCREDIAKAQPRKLFPGGKLKILLASPSCTHHSTARGGVPVSDQLRSQPYQAVRWARDLDIEMVVVENVAELTKWGPTKIVDCKKCVVPNGKISKDCRLCKGQGRVEIAIKDGSIFRKWIKEFQLLGYAVEWKILNSADYGAATSRKRFFLVARKNGRAPAWPKPTHSKDGSGGLKKWRGAKEIIDFTQKGRSIFEMAAEGDGLCDNTLMRIAEGFRRYSGVDLKPFLIEYYGTGTAASVDKPLETVTAQGNKFGLVVPALVKTDHTFLVDEFGSKDNWASRTKSVDQPVGALTGAGRWAKVDTELQPFTLGQQSGAAPRSTEDPLNTVAGGGAISLVDGVAKPADFLVRSGGPDGAPTSADEPVPAILRRNHHCIVTPETKPFILPPQGIMGDNPNLPRSVEDPMQTITAGRGGGHLVEGVPTPIAELPVLEIPDLEAKLAAMEPTEPDDGVCRDFDNDSTDIAVEGDDQCIKCGVIWDEHPKPAKAKRLSKAEKILQLVMASGGPKSQMEARPADAPLPTIIGNTRLGYLSGEFKPLIVGNGGPEYSGKPKTTDDPLGTVQTENHRALVMPILMGLTHGGRLHDVNKPLPTITTAHRGEMAIAQAKFLTPNFGEKDGQAPRTHDIENPLPAVTGHGAGALIEGIPHLIEYYGNGRPQSLESPLPTQSTRDRFALIVPLVYQHGAWYILDIRFRMLTYKELAAAMGFESFVFEGIEGVKITIGDIVKGIGNAVEMHQGIALIGANMEDVGRTLFSFNVETGSDTGGVTIGA